MTGPIPEQQPPEPIAPDPDGDPAVAPVGPEADPDGEDIEDTEE